MNLGARTAAWSGSGLSAKSYVQDGLIHMWDGIENTGFGSQNTSSRTWKDLVGSYDASLNQNASFDSNSLYSDGSDNYMAIATGGFSPMCIEASFKIDRIVATTCLVFYSNSGSYYTKYVMYNSSNGSTSFAGWGKMPNYVFAGSIFSGTTVTGNYSSGGVLVSCYEKSESLSLYSVNAGGAGAKNIYFGGSNEVLNFAGHIYCVRCYNRVLEPSEIAANYAVDKARFGLT